MQLIKQFLKLKYCEIWRFKQWAPFVFKMRQILLPLFKTGVFSRCVTHRYPRSVCDCCDQAMRNSQFLASHLVSTVTLWAWAREACVASKQTHEAGGGWVREGERVFQNRAVCGLTVHNLFIGAHERKSERGERKARPHPLPPTQSSLPFCTGVQFFLDAFRAASVASLAHRFAPPLFVDLFSLAPIYALATQARARVAHA